MSAHELALSDLAARLTGTDVSLSTVMRASCRAFLKRIHLDPQLDRFELVHRYERDRYTTTEVQDWLLK